MAWVNTSSPNETDPGAPCSPRNSHNESNLSVSAIRRRSDGESQHVGFHSQGGTSNAEIKEREKYLTAKYPKHTMGLIRRRLAVEDWIDEQLKRLYNVLEDSYESYDANIDLDDILDLDEESERIDYINKQVSNAPQSPSVINKFIDELLQKAREL